MDISNIQIKVSMSKGADVDYKTWHRVFNQWIPDPVDDTLIDVADYSHVPNGPVALLAGHNANYAIDATGGSLGFACKRKKPLEGSFADRLEHVLRTTLAACVRLEEDPAVSDRIAFEPGRVQITLNDRLVAPNTDETMAAIQADLDAVLAKLYGGSDVRAERVDDPRRRLTVEVQADNAPKTAQLLQNLSA